MTNLKFKINNVDFSSYVTNHEYYSDLIPVQGVGYTDLLGYEHPNVLRYNGYLEVGLNYMTQAQLTALANVLNTQPVTVQYYNFKKGQEVTQSMTCNWEKIKDEIRNFKTVTSTLVFNEVASS